jgi:GNAT superfamily N-acetyltransferase
LTRTVEIVRAGEIDGTIVELGRTAFGKPRGLYREYLEWKYLHNPYRAEPLLYVARDRRGRAVAMRGFYGARWSTPYGLMEIPCADDFAIASEHRTSGIATELMRSALADLPEHGVQYVVNASGGQVTVLQSLAAGWKSLGGVDPLDRAGQGRNGFTFARRARSSPRRALEALGKVDGVAASPDALAMAALAETTSGVGRIRHVRDPAFFRWRYANPQRDYRFLVVDGADGSNGYVAVGLQRPRPDTLPLFIADWEGDSLLAHVVEICSSVTIRVWAASVSADTRSLLDRLGFEPAQPELRARGLPCLLFRPVGSHDPEVTAAIEGSIWDVRLIDSMHG